MIDPRILGVLWNELPAGSHENYKLKYRKGEALAQPVTISNKDRPDPAPNTVASAPEDQGASMATTAVAGHMRQQFENDQERLEQDLWSEYDKLKKS